MLAKDHYF